MIISTTNFFEEATKKSATLSSSASLALIISAVVILVFGLGFYIGVKLWSKKLRQKYDNAAQREAIIKIESLRNDIGLLPQILKLEMKSKANDYDIEGLINTVYQNNFKHALIISAYDLFPFICLSQKTQNPIYYEPAEFDFETYSKWKFKFPEEFPNPIIGYDGGLVELVAVYESKLDLLDLYDNYYKILAPKGMLAIRLEGIKKSQLKTLLTQLAISKIQHDISYFGTKFLFIVKS